ncbi:MAG: dihydropteroate synthase [Alphaproteobacteria bacterium]|nr:dihydropteroate synthase [Alphaproteobacteria bacterium]
MDSPAGASRLRLTPLGLVSGAAAIAVCQSGDGLALAGGPLAFTHARIMGVDAPGHAQSDKELLTAPDMLRWATQAAHDGDQGPAALIGRTSQPRPVFADMVLCGAGARPRIMGVCNVTPDSFSDGGDHAGSGQAIAFARQLAGAGADIVDVGGESTRPGADPVSERVEIERVLPVIEELIASGVPVSIDTRRAGVMRAAIDAGVALINDVSGLSDDPDALGVVAASNLPVILMHMQGQPKSMQDDPSYADVVQEVYDALAGRIDACLDAGIAPERLAVDPGFGFGKTVAHNLELLAHLAQFHGLGCPIVVGLSRKSFIGALTGEKTPSARVTGSIAAALKALDQGAQIARVHDVAETRQAFDVWRAAL